VLPSKGVTHVCTTALDDRVDDLRHGLIQS
jgi:hypothetical protein